MAKPAAAASVVPGLSNPMAAAASFGGGTFDLIKQMSDTVTKIAKKTRT